MKIEAAFKINKLKKQFMCTNSKRKDLDESGVSKREGKLLIKIGKALIKRRIKGKEKIKAGLCNSRRLESSDKELGLILEKKGLVKVRELKKIDQVLLTNRGIEFFIKNKNREFFK